MLGEMEGEQKEIGGERKEKILRVFAPKRDEADMFRGPKSLIHI